MKVVVRPGFGRRFGLSLVALAPIVSLMMFAGLDREMVFDPNVANIMLLVLVVLTLAAVFVGPIAAMSAARIAPTPRLKLLAQALLAIHLAPLVLLLLSVLTHK